MKAFVLLALLGAAATVRACDPNVAPAPVTGLKASRFGGGTGLKLGWGAPSGGGCASSISGACGRAIAAESGIQSQFHVVARPAAASARPPRRRGASTIPRWHSAQSEPAQPARARAVLPRTFSSDSVQHDSRA